MGLVGRSILASVVVGALSAGIYKYSQHYRLGLPPWYHEARLPESVEALDVADTAKLKRVLFSGEPWLLQCYSGLPYAGQWLPTPFWLDSAFKESLSGLRSIVKFGTLDCEKVLPSNNKTLVAKFGLVRRTQPLLIYAGGGDRPRQVPSASATSAYGITAFVKPKAEPKVRFAKSQQALDAYCGGRRACLVARIDSDSSVLEQLARRFRTVEVVSIGEEGKSTLSWGRGEEVGETLEEDEAQHFGKRVSLLRADPTAPKPTRKGARPAPRLLRGFNGAEDLPSLSRFVEQALEAPADDGFVSSPLPKLGVVQKPKPLPKENDNAERQAKRARARAAARANDEAEVKLREEALRARSEAQRKQRELDRRQQMADEEAQAENILEELVDEEGDGADYTHGAEEEVGSIEIESEEDEIEVDVFDDDAGDGTDALDLDA